MASGYLFYLIFLFAATLAQNTTNSTITAASVLQYVDPLIGTDNGGNVFAGATLPYGMAKAVADVDGQNTCGFATDGSNVTGFSHMHDAGVGSYPSLGNFPLFPQYCAGDVLDNCNFIKTDRATHYVNDSVVATPGYFALDLVSGIQAEMTVSQHAALYKFTFPSNGTDGAVNPLILVDLTDINDGRQNATVIVDETTGRISGNGTFIPSFGGGSFVSYFCADFSGADILDNGIWVNNRAGTDPKELFVPRGINAFYLEAGGFVRFEPPSDGVISARVGVSLVSIDKACQNAETEIPEPWDFDGLKSTAETAWEEKLSVISIDTDGVDDDLITTFWSAIYRTMMSPQDYTGENPLWESSEPYFDSFYCIWDSFRTQFPFLTVVDPSTLTLMLRSLLDTYKHLGWLPDCRMSLCKGFTQGGSNADVVFADAWVKNLTADIDWDLAYEALVNDAENEPFDWSNEGRGGLQSWKSLDYVPALDFDYLGFGTNSRSISRTLEYSYNDYCIATLGKGLGKENYTTYLERSTNWQNLWKDDQTSEINGTDTGFVGFPQPKFLNGTWAYQDPIACSPLADFCSLTTNPLETYEDSIWSYQFFVPHDFATLIALVGDLYAMIERLDYVQDSGLFDIGNEVSFLVPYLYHYASRPGISAARLHTYIPAYFSAATDGLPGNDDSGAMGSRIAFIMAGLFPNAGQDVYLISPPFFSEVNFTNPMTNKTATIRNSNFDPGYSAVYIQNATLNGEYYAKNWIGHDFFLNGGVLELTLGFHQSAWGTADEDLPPSASTASTSMRF